ncbi:serine/threonine-protein phosphatase CPPED1 [Callorhinchus milii]|uniref:Serine/threonine-protein phosphatase CPPED1 n=1 Tax=Callorhinchus milii TaxID=7868 RepID=A0A4W3HWW5_CALMI|nr:serine/threonine-protein phosphatase CPPED1 [Callorhinchus milii]|eukprot:gi/632952506/ref/XP_007891890.1/ PREDICTED: calcineurin-like phosphoesterase domain-containing protein 1 [Callorhinchus milii]
MAAMTAPGDRQVFLRARDRGFAGLTAEEDSEWKGPFYFIQGADPQFGLMKAWNDEDCDNGGDEWKAEIQLTEQAVQAINRLTSKPKFFLLCGDLIHAMPGSRWREEQLGDLKRTLKGINPTIPLVFVSGNHDIGNTPTPENIAEYCSHWGDDYFTFWVGGVMFLVLNSQFYYDASRCPELKQAHDRWLEAQLAVAEQCKCKHVIVFQHIPLFLQNVEEENNYFNLEKSLRLEILQKFHKAGVKAVFSGHYHRNAGGVYKDLEMVVTSAIGCQLGKDKHGVRVVAITEDKIVHKYVSLDELSELSINQTISNLFKVADLKDLTK